MPNIIVTFQAPTELDDYRYSYYQNYHFGLDNLLSTNDDDYIWTCDRTTKAGDLMFFRPGVYAAARIVPIIKAARQLYPMDAGFLAFMDQQKVTYKKYAGNLFAVGVAETDAYLDSNDDRWYAPITNLRLLDSPIPYDDLKIIKKVNPAGTVTRLDQESFERIAALIIDRNPDIAMDALREAAAKAIAEEIKDAFNEETSGQENPAATSNAGELITPEPPSGFSDTHNVVTHKSSDQYARDQKLVQKLKSLYQCKCQLCQQFFDITMDNGLNYVEVHHITPNSVGYDDEGKSVDNPANMIVVCPNHHRYLHYHKGGQYKLEESGGALYLANAVDRIRVLRDLHLQKLMNSH